MHNLTELKIWNKAIDLAVDVYTSTSTYLVDERFGLMSQLRRASVSIPSNIAEGTGRNSKKEFCNFLGIANGSCFEVQTQLIISNKLGLLKDDILSNLLNRVDELQKNELLFSTNIK